MVHHLIGTIAAHWDGRASSFDDEPDHGLLDPVVRAAWRHRLTSWLPAPPARVADLGCGTGSLAVLLATMGYEVRPRDRSVGDDVTAHGDYETVHHALPWYGGVDRTTLVSALESRFARVEHDDLSSEAALWGREVADERFAVVAYGA